MKNGYAETTTLTSLGPKILRTVEQAKLPNPDTVVHESEDVAATALEAGKRDTRELLARIRHAGSSQKALAAIRDELTQDLRIERKKRAEPAKEPDRE